MNLLKYSCHFGNEIVKTATRTMALTRVSPPYRYLNQDEARNLDLELFNEYKFSVDQLMELAGLSCAMAVAKAFPNTSPDKSVLVVCGPGNNGGDGLVAARHLIQLGYKSTIFYPKRPPNRLLESLLHQCNLYGASVRIDCPSAGALNCEYSLIVDALFGFSYKPPVRAEYKPIVDMMITSPIPVCSIDIPSGWDVDNGPSSDCHIKPQMLISLSAPKQCAEYIDKNCLHYLGGRFISAAMQKKYELSLPEYPGTELVVRLPK